MKIYTKHGDDGSTSLYGGDRVKKSALRLEAYGTVDELNAILGLALAGDHDEEIGIVIRNLQKQLFILGADLSTPAGANNRIERIGPQHTTELELTIDRLDSELPDLKHFILPGGTRCGALLHQARTVCRRAERASVAHAETGEINRDALIYMNRLSDLLFVMARFENLQKRREETPWIPEKK